MAYCEKCALKCTDEIKIAKHHKGRMPMGNCIDFTPKQTNADRIRSMSNEELAEFLVDVETHGYHDQSVSGTLEMIDWLQAEAEE